VKEGLGGDAAAVEADAAQLFVLLDEEDFFAKVGGVEGGGITAGAGAEYNEFSSDGFHVGVEWWSGGVVE
jgi:hypothetical protein